MSGSFIMVDDFPRGWRARPALRGPMQPRRKLPFARRLAILAAAIAVPALAAPDTLARFAGDETVAQSGPIVPMGYEIAGESFPGSAFYYLEDAPAPQDAAVYAEHASARSATPAALANLFDAGPAARALVAMGSDTDQARAQRCLSLAIYYEAASESDSGQRAVAQVVLNRVAHPAYPSTVCGVVFQGSERSTGCQFTFTCDGSLARRPQQASWDRAARVARQALAGYVHSPIGLATHYHTLAVNPYWASSLDHAGTIGAHIFYRWRGTAGTPRAFSTRYLGGEPAPGAYRAQPEAPDPASPPALQFVTAILPAAASAPAPVADPAPAAGQRDTLPGGGGVRAEYANSGAWLPRS